MAYRKCNAFITPGAITPTPVSWTPIIEFGLFVVTRGPADSKTQAPVAKVIDNQPRPAAKTHADEPAPGDYDPDVATLVHYANTDRNRRLSAQWSRIEKPARRRSRREDRSRLRLVSSARRRH